MGTLGRAKGNHLGARQAPPLDLSEGLQAEAILADDL